MAEDEDVLRHVGPGFEQRWPGAEALSTDCAINLTMLSSRLTQFSQALTEQHGLPSPAAFNLLAILQAAGRSLAPSEIAARMIVARPTVSGILGSLAARGLVRLEAGSGDRRTRAVSITPAGAARLRQMFPDLHRRERQLFDCLNGAEKRQLLKIMGKLLMNFPDLSRPAT